MTNGIVSVVRGGRVVMKFVTGCDGYNAGKLADRVRATGLPESAPTAHAFALNVGFGCPDCLVIQTPDSDYIESGDELPAIYRDKFADPRFNPRWDLGTAAHAEIVDLPV